jgi:hypothetical protein
MLQVVYFTRAIRVRTDETGGVLYRPPSLGDVSGATSGRPSFLLDYAELLGRPNWP